MRPLVMLFLWAAAGPLAAAQAPIEYRGRQPAPEIVAPPAQTMEPAPGAEENPPPLGWEGPGTPLAAYALRPEEVHPFDPRATPRMHSVARGETLYDIAVRYQIPLRALIEANRLSAPYALSEGRALTLPPPRLHRVAAGETLADIAARYAMDRRSLGLLNRLEPPFEVRPGQELVLPATVRDLGGQAPPRLVPTPAAPPTPLSSARFVWPVTGEVVTRYGAQAGGRRSDGVEIAADEGAPIRAAADGEVVYAGADLPAYGALIMIRHADGWVSTYGYGRRALVSPGARVRRGQPIGEAGVREGRGLLLFQLRQGREAVDPLPLLGR